MAFFGFILHCRMDEEITNSMRCDKQVFATEKFIDDALPFAAAVRVGIFKSLAWIRSALPR